VASVCQSMQNKRASIIHWKLKFFRFGIEC
jgi:hypothetical protein